MQHRVLVTNDDGINAPGLAVMERIARQFTDEDLTYSGTCAPSRKGAEARSSSTWMRGSIRAIFRMRG